MALSDQGFLSIARSLNHLVAEPVPPVLEETLGEGMGTVILVGGGVMSSGKDHEEVFAKMLSAAGGNRPRLAILSSSVSDAETAYYHFYYKDPAYGSFEDNYKAMGFEPVFIPLAMDTAQDIKNDPYWAGVLKNCLGAYLQGGDQYKHVKSLLNDDGSPSLILEALNHILNKGGVVAGTSADMAAMGDYAYGYGYTQEALSHNAMEFKDLSEIPFEGSIRPEKADNNLAVQGIGLISDKLLVDTHFDQRGRLGRLLVAMRDTGKTIGIGLDEGTALSIQNHIGQVVGDQGLFVVDATQATFGPQGPDAFFMVENLKIHYLTQGDQFDFWTNNAMQAPDKFQFEGMDAYDQDHQLFGQAYQTTKILVDFAQAKDQVLEVPYKLANGKIITFAFEKNQTTKAYNSNTPYKDKALEGYYKTAIENLGLSVYEHKGADDLPPVIGYMTAYTKSYKVYLGITDNLSGVDEGSVNANTVQFISDTNSLYKEPFFDAEYDEIAIVIEQDNFSIGDQVVVSGVKDLAGNPVENQTWRFDGQVWIKE